MYFTYDVKRKGKRGNLYEIKLIVIPMALDKSTFSLEKKKNIHLIKTTSLYTNNVKLSRYSIC